MSEHRTPRVILFSSGHCPWCGRAKKYLKERGVRVKEIRVDRDPDAAKDVVRMTGRKSVPVMLIGHHPVVGFDRAKIDGLLHLKTAPDRGET